MRILWVLLLWLGTSLAQTTDPVPAYWNAMVGSAFTENRAYPLLQAICDLAGGRAVGSPQNEKAQKILIQRLTAQGLDARREFFEMPGWVRGQDELWMVAPTHRKLRAVALGYSPKTPLFKSPVIYGFSGQKAVLDSLEIKGKIVLIGNERPHKGGRPLRGEVIRFAARGGARAVLFINRKNGGLCLAGIAGFDGKPAPIPAFSITKEEGLWLKRLLMTGQKVVVQMNTRSYCKLLQTSNVVVTLPGKVHKKIVLGAHFDSWDLGQGAIDNGLGTAILFEVARIIHRFHAQNYYTLEFVWFNGEELGLWGSKNYVKQHQNDSLLAMINMDMTGRVTGFNAMGFDEFLPLFHKLAARLQGFNLTSAVTNKPWPNSDHFPFLLEGIPVITTNAHLDGEQANYYHSFGDTFDKVRVDYLAQSAGIMAILATELANRPEIPLRRHSRSEIRQMLEHYGLDRILKRENTWPF